MNSAGHLLSLGSCIPAHFCAVLSASGISSPCWVTSNQPQNGSKPPSSKLRQSAAASTKSLTAAGSHHLPYHHPSLFSKHYITPWNLDSSVTCALMDLWLVWWLFTFPTLHQSEKAPWGPPPGSALYPHSHYSMNSCWRNRWVTAITARLTCISHRKSKYWDVLPKPLVNSRLILRPYLPSRTFAAYSRWAFWKPACKRH